MGYKCVKDTGKPDYHVLVMQYKSDPSELTAQKKIARLVVDLVLFDFELTTILQCVKLHNERWRNDPCNILNALEARKKTQGGVDKAVKCLQEIVRNESKGALRRLEKNKLLLPESKKPFHQQTGSSSGTLTESGDYITPQGSFTTPSRNAKATETAGHKDSSFPRIDPAKDLPPPDIDDPSVNFTSVHHTNPSSEYDDDHQLIPESTHLGYRNPPESKHNRLAGCGPTVDPQVTAGRYEPAYPPQTTAASTTKYPPPTVVTTYERDRLNYPSDAPQFYQNKPPYQTQDDVPRDNTHPYYNRSTSHGSADGLHSLPTDSIRSVAGNTNFQSIGGNTQLAPTGGTSPSRNYAKQKSMPASPGSSNVTVPSTTSFVVAPTGAMAAVVTRPPGITAPSVYVNVLNNPAFSIIDNQSTSATKTTDQILFGDVPMGKPAYNSTISGSTTTGTYTTSTANPKLGTLDLDNLRKKNKQRTDEATAHLNVQVSQRNKQDFSSVRKHLNQKKEATAQVVGKIAKPKEPNDDYANIDVYSPAARAAIRELDNPPNRPPMAAPRVKKDSAPEKIAVEYWQCARCEVVNEAKRSNCKKCQIIRGSLSASQAYCSKLCNLIVYVPEKKLYTDITCPMCKELVDTGYKYSVI